jgi:inner membrane protein
MPSLKVLFSIKCRIKYRSQNASGTFFQVQECFEATAKTSYAPALAFPPENLYPSPGMDNLTHTMLGVAMARAGLSRRYGKGTTLVLAAASNLPDVDALWVLAGLGEQHLSRRLLTHSVPGLLLLAAAGATFFRRLYRHQGWKAWFGLCLLAMTVHVFFDLVNSYGVVLFYPFSRARFELAWVFIIDLVLWVLLLAPAGIGPLLKRHMSSTRVWQASLLAVSLYVAGCGVARREALRLLHATAAMEQVTVAWAYVFPEALGPHRFRGVLKEPGGRYRVYLLRVISGSAESRLSLTTDEHHPAVEQSRATKRGRQLEWFFKAPVWRHELAEDGDLCSVYDLRFSSLVIDREIPFVYRFRLRDGHVEPLDWGSETGSVVNR